MVRKASVLLCLLLCYAASMSAAAVTFAPRKDIATGFQGVRGIAVADFNGDGKMDIAVTDVYDKRVVVYLNDGTGNFGAPISTTVNIGSTQGVGLLVAGDVNEDGKQDLVVSSVGGIQPTYVLLGTGNGSFTQGALVPGSFTAGRLVDLNGDGHLDLVGVYTTADRPAVSLGDGKGNFTSVAIAAPTPAALPYGLYGDVVVADFNRDGHPDIIAAQETVSSAETPALQFYAGVGDGTFRAPQALLDPDRLSHGFLATADFDGDGKLDLLDGSASLATIFPGYGDGTFGMGKTTATFLYLPLTIPKGTAVFYSRIAAADLNADGFVDAIAASQIDNRIDVLLNDGKATFQQQVPDFSAAIAGTVGTLLTADLNGDGLPDLIVTDTKTQAVSYFLSIKPKVVPTLAISSSPAQVLAGNPLLVSVVVAGTNTSKPSGTVTLLDGSQSLGQATLDGSGSASFSLPSLTVGTHALSASYAGDTNFTSATSTAPFAVTLTDVTVALPTSTQTIKAGAIATYTVNLTPVANFTGTVTLTCSGLPSSYSCGPTSTSISGQPVIASIKVSSAVAGNSRLPRPFTTNHRNAVVVCAGILLICCLPSRRRIRGGLLACTVAALLSLTMMGCSGGSGAVTPVTPPYTGSTSFTITATLTQGSQTAVHTTMATLIVQ